MSVQLNNFVTVQKTADKQEQLKHTFWNPYQASVLEGGDADSTGLEVELVAILSSN